MHAGIGTHMVKFSRLVGGKGMLVTAPIDWVETPTISEPLTLPLVLLEGLHFMQ